MEPCSRIVGWSAYFTLLAATLLHWYHRGAMTIQRPLILITNDDGITSKGLRFAAEALEPLGELLIAAPHQQQSGAGRSMLPTSEGRIYRQALAINGHLIAGYGIEGTPAQVVQHGLFEICLLYTSPSPRD